MVVGDYGYDLDIRNVASMTGNMARTFK